ncbi:uncharacterized protein LOC142983818 isoform X2 [Anticarsia gemmatalis]
MNKRLCANAVPTLFLPGTEFSDDASAPDKTKAHSEILCNSCKKPILGYRYKCITCIDYDLCTKCEMFEVHPEHYMLRVPKPVNFKVADDLVKKWQKCINKETHSKDESSSDDDIPINRYAKTYDSGIDLSEDIKTKIRNEITRILDIKHDEPKKIKRKKEVKKKDSSKKKKTVDVEKFSVPVPVETVAVDAMVPVAFADVNDIAGSQILNIKDEMPAALTSIDSGQPMADLNLSDVDFMMDVNTRKTMGLF